MKCKLVATGKVVGGWSEYTCPSCNANHWSQAETIQRECVPGREHRLGPPRSAAEKLGPPRPPSPPKPPLPGTCLYKRWLKAGVKKKKGCKCDELIDEMNRLGVDGCRVAENRARIIATMEQTLAEHYTGLEIAGAGLRMWWNGLPLSIAEMYDLAVNDAERLAQAD